MSVAEQASLNLTLSEIPKTGFSPPNQSVMFLDQPGIPPKISLPLPNREPISPDLPVKRTTKILFRFAIWPGLSRCSLSCTMSLCWFSYEVAQLYNDYCSLLEIIMMYMYY